MEIDVLDTKILGVLSVDSRLPLTQLAKRVRASREVVTYRMHRLEKQGVIRGYVTEIPYERLGYVGAALFVSVRHKDESAFEKYIASQPHIAWIGKWVGVWSYGMSVLGCSLEEVDACVHELLERFSGAIRDSQFVFHKRTTYFHEKLFGASFHERKSLEYRSDETDKRILVALSTDSRVDAASLAVKLNLSGVAIGQRIRKLEQSGIIRRYGLFLDIAKLGYTQYSVFMKNNHVADRSKLFAALEAHPAVHMLFEYIGDQFLEFGVCIKEQHELRSILSEIESAFPENRVLSVHVLQDDVLSVAPPAIIFEQGIKAPRKN